MARERKGSIINREGMIYARITFTDAYGKRHDLKRRAENRSHARQIIRSILGELDTTGEKGVLDGSRLTFQQLAAVYEQERLVPAQYFHGTKQAGLRSWKTPRSLLSSLVHFFGSRRVREIAHSEIQKFKLSRLATPTHLGKERTVASVNRELELLRAMLRYAKRQSWISRSPFEMGAPLINKSDEVRRERVLTHEEEARLLDACVDKRAHLRPLIIAALDTGARRGELLKLRWSNVDTTAGMLLITAMNSKTGRARTIAMTSRLEFELRRLWNDSTRDPDALVFWNQRHG